MFKRKKNARRLIAFGLCLMMLMSAGIVAYASLEDTGSFNLVLPAGGEKMQTAAVGKYNYNPTAIVNFTTCENKSQSPVWYRLHDAATGANASKLYGVYGTGVQYPPYTDGYGGYGTGYYIMMQTDSTSKYDATVKGSWEP